jgi:glycosyltransferase involved in cell wall biosynthesis
MWVHNDVSREQKNDIKYRILRFFFKSKYKHFDKFVCVSNGLIEPFKKLNKIKHNNFEVISNLVLSEEIIKKSKEKVDIVVDSNKYNLVSVGRFVIQKGFDILINDMKEIVSKRKDIHLYIIGDGKQKKKLESLVKKNNLEDYITFLGSKSNPFKYERLMDGFVLESRYEGQGIVILEAKVLGLDLIIPDRLKDYIEDVPFTNDVCKTILSLKKKKEKEIDMLEKYNKNIIKKINMLFDEEK